MSQTNIDVAKFNINSQYAPGIATYGMEGKKGDIGISGNFVYLTDMTKDELEVAISNGIFPMKGKTERLPVNRNYAANDIFIMYTGEIYKLNELMVLNLCGLINTNEGNIYMDEGYNVVVNTSTGMVIDVTDYSAHRAEISNTALQIYNNKYDNGQIQFIKLFGVDNNITLKLNIYYDINTDSFYFDSDKPIIFNNGINTNPNSYESIDEKYYPVITYKDNEYMSISQFNLIALKIKYTCYKIQEQEDNLWFIYLHIGDASDDLAKIAQSYIITGNNIDSIRDEVYLKLYLSTNEIYLFPLTLGFLTPQKELRIPLKTDDQNKNIASNCDIDGSTIMMASLMYNTEIVIREDKTHKITNN